MQLLSRVPVGKPVTVTELSTESNIRRRLLDLGFTPGTPLTCLFSAPGGNPRAYRIHETVIALRNADADSICTLPKEHGWVRP
ncbi:MAG: FeoA family protein [Clostridia bacterium]